MTCFILPCSDHIRLLCLPSDVRAILVSTRTPLHHAETSILLPVGSRRRRVAAETVGGPLIAEGALRHPPNVSNSILNHIARYGSKSASGVSGVILVLIPSVISSHYLPLHISSTCMRML